MNNRIKNRWILSLLLAAVLTGTTFLPVFAAPTGEDGENLEAFYQRELELLASQAERLAKADDVVNRVEDYIAEQQAKGSDTSGAEQALSDFESALAGIQSDHDAAANILNTHSGFDDAGNVTDTQAALETVRTAGESLRQVHLNLVQALKDLRTTLQDSHSYTGMEDALQKLLEVQQAQSDHLLEGQDIITRMEEFIAEQQDLGRDTGSLEDALASFEADYALAEADNVEAGSILDSRAGFSESGKVTDPSLARITLSSAGEVQQQFHLTATQARIDLKEAVREYIDSFESHQSS